MTQTKKSIVILGGSYAGIAVAHYLLKHVVPQQVDKEFYEVTLVSPSPDAFWRPASPRAMIADDLLPRDKVFVNIPKMFKSYPNGSFRFINGTAIELDHINRTVLIEVSDARNEMVDYYALIIATGSSTHSPLMGLIEDKKRLEASWYDFRKALKNAKSIVIAGGGPTGVETAGELGEYLNGRASFLQTNLKSPQVTVTIVTSSPQILPHLRTSIARKAEAYLAKIGVTVIKNVRVESVSPTGAGTGAALTTKARVTLGNGKILDADIYIPATGMRPNTSYIDPGLLTEDGLVDTDTTLRVGKAGPRVYAIGDVASCGRPGIPGIYNAVPVLGSNMKRDLFVAAGKDSDSLEKYRVFKDDTRESQLVPIGKSKGVGAVNGYQLPSFMVWLIKGRDYALWTGGGLWTGKNWAKET